MASTYTTSNKLDKQGVGDNSATWGTVLNTQLNLIDSSLDARAGVALSGATSTMTMVDGAASDIRSRILVFTGALSANHTVTVAPNTVPKWWFVKNQTSGGFNVIITQGSGGNVTIPFGNQWSIVMVDGQGAGAAVTAIDNPYFPGNVQAGYFIGNGAGITDLNPNEISDMSHVRAKTEAGQSISDVTATLIVFGTEDYDTQSEYNVGTGRFTASLAGYYRVTATIRFNSITTATTKSLGLEVYKNGSSYAAAPGWLDSSTGTVILSSTVDTTLYLSGGEYVEIFATQNTGATRTLEASAVKNFLCIDRLI